MEAAASTSGTAAAAACSPLQAGVQSGIRGMFLGQVLGTIWGVWEVRHERRGSSAAAACRRGQQAGVQLAGCQHIAPTLLAGPFLCVSQEKKFVLRNCLKGL